MLMLARIRACLLTASIAILVLAWAAAGHAAANAKSQADLRAEETALRNAVHANPNDADAHVKLGRFYLEYGNPAAAEAEARKAKNLAASSSSADALLAFALLSEGKTTQLLDQIQPASREAEDESTVRMSLGVAHLYLQEFDAAQPLLQDAVRLDPQSVLAHLALAHYFLITSQLSGARQQIDAAGAISANEIGVLRYSAELSRAEGNVDGAIAGYAKVLAINPDNVLSLDGRADALLTEGKVAEAQHDIAHALSVAPRDQESIYLNALILAREGKIAAADDELTAINSHFNELRICYYLQGVTKFWLDQYEQADLNLAKFVSQQPDVAGAQRLRAEIALRRNDPQDAVQFLEPVVEANPLDQKSATLLARAYVANGHPEQALALYQKIADSTPEKAKVQGADALMPMSYGSASDDIATIEEIAPSQQGSDAATVSIAEADLSRGEVDKASTIAEALAKAAPNDPGVESLLGSVRIAQKRLPEAETIFREVIKKKPDFTAASFKLAQVMVAEKQPDEAKAMLQSLVQRSP